MFRREEVIQIMVLSVNHGSHSIMRLTNLWPETFFMSEAEHIHLWAVVTGGLL